MNFISKKTEDTLNLGIEIGKKLKPGSIISLKGDLGTGKTVIAKGIGLALNVAENITSPTYNIICEYSGKIPFYHMDLYRISDYDEFEMLGVDHLLFGTGITVIEWSERIEEELPDDIIHITITRDSSNEYRNIVIKGLE